MADAPVIACDGCSMPMDAPDAGMHVPSGQRFHVTCWWRHQLLAGFEVIDAARQRARARLSEARAGQPVLPARPAERFESAPPPAERRDGDAGCVLCGQAIRTGAPGYRNAVGLYHVACWEQPTPRTSWLLLGPASPLDPRDPAVPRTPWENPSTPTGDPICLLCAEGIEVAQPVIHAQGWLAHTRCWAPAPAGSP
jgi:hypothetical protein